MADRSIVVRLQAAVSEFKRGMGEAAKSTEAVGSASEAAGKKSSKSFSDVLSWVDKNEQHVTKLTTQIGLVGVGLTAMAALAVKSFADFDAAMSSVQAATMESTSNMVLLRDAAIDAGARTAYSATEAAGAVEELAKAGVSTADILGGALDGALDLAASGAIAVSDAAEIAATAMTQFGLGGQDVTHIADLLAAGAGKAQGGVGDLGMALKQAGLVADQTGLSIEETTAGLTAFAAAGLVGSDAGTSFKSMLQRLTPQSQEAKSLMDDLGISAYDASGNFIGLADFAGNLQQAMKDLTPEQRNAAMATIFGSDAVRAANVLYEQGAAGIQKWTAAVDDQGYAAEQARIRTDNLKGDIERLGGSLDTALIQSGSGANDVLREMAQRAEAVVDWVGSLSSEALTATTSIAGAGGLALLGIAGLGKLTVSIAEAKAAMTALKISASAAGVAAAGIGAVLFVGTNLLSQWAEAAANSKQNTEDFASTLDEATGAVTSSTEAMAAQKVASSESARIYQNMGGDVADLTAAVLGNGDALARVNQLLDEQPKEKFAWMEFDNTGVDQVRSDLEGLGGDLDSSQEKWQLQADAAKNSTVATTGAADAQSSMRVSTEATTFAVEDQVAALEALVDAQAKLAGLVLSERDAQRNLEAAYAAVTASIKDNGKSLDITTEKGRANQAALDDVARSGWDLIESMQANGSTSEELQASMQSTRDRFVALAQQFGITAEDASALADELNLIPSKVDTVATFTDQASSQIQEFVNRWAGKTVTVRAIMEANPSLTQQQAADAARYTGQALSQAGRHADGGAIYGPGTGTSDSILARLSAGEHVWTAAEVAATPGGHAGVERLRAGALAGTLPAFADGGRVAWAKSTMQWARAAGRPQSEIDEWADLVKRLSAIQTDLQVGERRGTLVSQATGSLSGAYSVVDEMRAQAMNADLGAAERAALSQEARTAEASMKRLYDAADGVQDRLAAARDRAQELSSIAQSVSSSLSREGALSSLVDSATTQTMRSDARGNVWYEGGDLTSASLVNAARSKAQGIRTFAGKLQRLQQLGLSGAMLQEVASLGSVEGGAVADALLSGPVSDIAALNSASADVATWSATAGQFVTEGFYAGGVAAADGLVAGLESQQAAVESQIEQIAKGMQSALKKALGIASPSKVMRALGRNAGGSIGLGLDDSVPDVEQSARALADAAIPGMEPWATGYAVPSGSSEQVVVQTGDTTAYLTDSQVDDLISRLSVAFETGSSRVTASAFASAGRAARYATVGS